VRRRQLGELSPAVKRLELVTTATAAAIGEPPTAPGRVEVAHHPPASGPLHGVLLSVTIAAGTPPLRLTAAGAHEIGSSWARRHQRDGHQLGECVEVERRGHQLCGVLGRPPRSPRPPARWRPTRRAPEVERHQLGDHQVRDHRSTTRIAAAAIGNRRGSCEASPGFSGGLSEIHFAAG
jgi:hypothetical protein